MIRSPRENAYSSLVGYFAEIYIYTLGLMLVAMSGFLIISDFYRTRVEKALI